MRPPEFTGGNTARHFQNTFAESSFNEAAGIHRRKQVHLGAILDAILPSMRPPEFTGGNNYLTEMGKK